MRKIPTLFVRDEQDRRYVTQEVTPGCEWVLAGEGEPTRKYDGTCVTLFDGRWWARREVKDGKPAPDGWFPITDADPNTGKRVGWEPIESSGFVKWWREAVGEGNPWREGTYELIGPKINGNPEKVSEHALIFHDTAEVVRSVETCRTVGGIREAVAALRYEGIVWHHPDGRMVKLKRRDLPSSSA